MANANAINSGVPGTAATKTASDNAQAVVASVDGATVINQVAVFADTAGTIETGTAFRTVAMQVFSANGTYTPTAGMQFCVVEIVSGGGGGGGSVGSVADFAAGAGGCGGGYSRKVFDAATIGASQAVTIGAGGAGGAAGNNIGVDGGATTFGALMTASGGPGGPAQTAQTADAININTSSGGVGGTAAIALNTRGYTGMAGIVLHAASIATSGQGGNSIWGGGGVSVSAGNDGEAAVGFGAGGSGGASNTTDQAGGAGTDGFCVVTEFIL